MKMLDTIILFIIALVVSLNFYLYAMHYDSNYCAAEIDYVKHGIGELIDHHGLDHLE